MKVIKHKDTTFGPFAQVQEKGEFIVADGVVYPKDVVKNAEVENFDGVYPEPEPEELSDNAVFKQLAKERGWKPEIVEEIANIEKRKHEKDDRADSPVIVPGELRDPAGGKPG